MKIRVPAIVLVALATPVLAQESQDARIAALLEEHAQALEDFQERLRETPADQRAAFVDRHRPDPADWTARLFEAAEEDPSTSAALDAFVWIARNDGAGDNGIRALESVVVDHLEADRAAEVLQSATVTDASRPLFVEAYQGSGNRTVRAFAASALASHAKELYDDASYGGGDVSGPSEEAIRWYRVVAEEYADVPHRGATLGEEAERNLFELERLAIGMVAPEIEGEDLDGVPFKLSDYRGQVVVLDFWGDW